MALVVRDASEKDAAFIAKMILQSSRAGKKDGIFDLIFEGKKEEDILLSLQKLTTAKQINQCSYKNFLIAEDDNTPIGSLCAYEPRRVTNETFIKALIEIGCDDGIAQRIAFVHDCDFELNNSTLMVDFLEEAQGHIDVGAIKALMQKSLLTARLKGYRRAMAIVEIGSLESLMMYEKLGFTKIQAQECDSYKERFGRVGLLLLSLEF